MCIYPQFAGPFWSLTFSSRLVHKYIDSEKNLEGERGDGMTNTFEQHHLLVMGQICCMKN